MRRRYIQMPDGTLVEVTQDWRPMPKSELQIISDIKPYRSMIDGREISSRSRHREHLREHNCIEVGNDSSLYRKPKPLESPPGLKEKIIRAVNIVEECERRSKCR